MITPYKGREVRPGDLVKIRWNRRTGGWSIMAANGTMRDRVVAQADKLQLADVEFRVSEAQRQRETLNRRTAIGPAQLRHWNDVISRSRGESLYCGCCAKRTVGDKWQWAGKE